MTTLETTVSLGADQLPVLAVERTPFSQPPAVKLSRRAPLIALLAVTLAASTARLGWTYRNAARDWLEARRPAAAPMMVEAPGPVNALGRLEPLGEVVQVAAPEGAQSARIARMLVKEGDAVAAGAVLAVLDSEDRLIAEKETAERRVHKSESLVTQARVAVGSTRAELAASLAAAKASARTERASEARQLALFRASYLSREAADLARLRREEADQRVHEVEAKLARYERVGAEFLDVTLALEEVGVARAALAEATARLEQAYVRAPLSGTVLDVHRRAGEAVAQGALVDLGATETMFARVDVYETEVGALTPGQRTRLSSDALGQPLAGAIERISTMVRKQSVVDALPAANTDARIVEVLVKLDPESAPAARRFVGLQVRAEFAR